MGDEFPDECAQVNLTDAAFRTHVEALVWTMRRETGGYLTWQDVRRFAETGDPEAAITELLAVGFWQRRGDGFQVRHHMEHQPEPDLIAKRREATANRVRKHRRRKAGLDTDSAPDTSSPVSAAFRSGTSPDPTRPDPGNASRNGVTPE